MLVDSAHNVREARRRDYRQRPQLNTRDMACWASYLRGQADALAMPIVDTSTLWIEDAATALHTYNSALASV